MKKKIEKIPYIRLEFPNMTQKQFNKMIKKSNEKSRRLLHYASCNKNCKEVGFVFRTIKELNNLKKRIPETINVKPAVYLKAEDIVSIKLLKCFAFLLSGKLQSSYQDGKGLKMLFFFSNEKMCQIFNKIIGIEMS